MWGIRYKVHLLVDVVHELTLTYKVTPANEADSPQLPPLLEEFHEHHRELMEGAAYLSGDKGYDCEANNRQVYDDYGSQLFLDIRATWKEDPGLPCQLYPDGVDTIFYTERGHVFYRNRGDGESERDNYTAMAYEGWDHKRGQRRCMHPGRPV